MSHSTTSPIGAHEPRSSFNPFLCGSTRDGWLVIGAALVYALVLVGSSWALKHFDLAQGWRLFVALVPVPFFAVFIWAISHGVRGMDELQRRVQTEALAFAFLASIVFLFALGQLERVMTLPAKDLGYASVWAFLPFLYGLGMVFAYRRYHR